MHGESSRRITPRPGEQAASGFTALPSGAAPEGERSAAALVLLFLGAFAAILLTGGRDQGSLGILLAVAGVVMLFFPPRQALGRRVWAAAGLLWACSTFALLPQAWFPTPPWRAELVASLVPVGRAVSLEPRSTVFWIAILGLSLLAGLFALSQCVESRHRIFAAQVAAVCVAIYGALAIFSALTGWHFPFDIAETFGFFPNRNHTATFLVTGSLLSLGLLGLPANRLGSVARVFAGAALLVCVVALLFFSVSRAGVIFLGLGATGWIVGCGRAHWKDWRLLLLGAAVLYGLLLFLAVPSQARNRLIRLAGWPVSTPANQPVSHDEGLGSRAPLYADTVSLIRDFPITGVGLGCFPSAFVHYREKSLDIPMALHPESDWLMLPAEAGLPALLSLLALVACVARRGFSERSSTAWPLRWAVIVAAATAGLHGLIDVPAHRVPLGWWILLLAALGCQRGRRQAEPATRAAHYVFMAGGLAAFVLGVMLIRAEWLEGPALPPFAAEKTSAALFQNRTQNPTAAIATARQAIARNPTADLLYFQLAALLLNVDDSALEADELLRAQRLLRPTAPRIPARQAELWLQRDPGRVPPLWRETLQRMLAIDLHNGTRRTLPQYRQLLVQARGHAELLESLRSMIDFPLTALVPAPQQQNFRFDLELAWLEAAGREGWEKIAPALLTNDPGLEQLTPAQRTQFLRLWSSSGDADALRTTFAAYPALEREGWATLAEVSAANREYPQACDLFFRYLPPPTLPRLPARRLEEAERAALVAPDDFVALYQLAAAQQVAGDWEATTHTLEKLASLPAPPGYVAWLRATAEAALEHWEPAWRQLQSYRAALPPRR